VKDLVLTLKKLEDQCLVADIMVSAPSLVCGDDELHAQRLLHERSEFNLIPIREDGRLVAFVERSGKTVARSTIELHSHIIGDRTSVLRLIDILVKREFCFVVKEDCIAGYVHFSDLNNRLVNLSLFAIVGAYEQALARKLRSNVAKQDYERLLEAKQLRRMKRLQESNSDLDWTTSLYFKEVLQLAREQGIHSINDDQIRLMNDSRNRICHAPRLLIEKHSDVKQIAQAKKLWLEFLESGLR